MNTNLVKFYILAATSMASPPPPESGFFAGLRASFWWGKKQPPTPVTTTSPKASRAVKKSASFTSTTAKLDTVSKGSEPIASLHPVIIKPKAQSPATPARAPTTRLSRIRRSIRRSVPVDNEASSYVAFMIYGRDAGVTDAAKRELQKLIEKSYKEVVITRNKCDTLLYLPHLGPACVAQLTDMRSSLAQILYGE